eukprot:g7106.t1
MQMSNISGAGAGAVAVAGVSRVALAGGGSGAGAGVDAGGATGKALCRCGPTTVIPCPNGASCCNIDTDTCMMVGAPCEPKSKCKREFMTRAFKPQRVPAHGRLPKLLSKAAVGVMRKQAAKAIPAQSIQASHVVCVLKGKKEVEVEETAEENVLGLFDMPVRVRAEEAGEEYYISLLTAYAPTSKVGLGTGTGGMPAWELHLVKAFQDPRTGKAKVTVMHPEHRAVTAADRTLARALPFAVSRQCASGRCSEPALLGATSQKLTYRDLTRHAAPSQGGWSHDDLTECLSFTYLMQDGAGQARAGVRQVFGAVVCAQEGNTNALHLVVNYKPQDSSLHLLSNGYIAVSGVPGSPAYRRMCSACGGAAAAGGDTRAYRPPQPSQSSPSYASTYSGAAAGAAAAAAGAGSNQGGDKSAFTWTLVLLVLGMGGFIYHQEREKISNQGLSVRRTNSINAYAEVPSAVDAEPAAASGDAVGGAPSSSYQAAS